MEQDVRLVISVGLAQLQSRFTRTSSHSSSALRDGVIDSNSGFMQVVLLDEKNIHVQYALLWSTEKSPLAPSGSTSLPCRFLKGPF
jgi:hypothetical protein